MLKKIVIVLLSVLLVIPCTFASDNNYVDEDNGFSIWFPEDWEITEESFDGGHSIFATSSPKEEVILEVHYNKDSSLGDYRSYSDSDFDDQYSTMKNLYVDRVSEYPVEEVMINDMKFYMINILYDEEEDFEFISYMGVYNNTSISLTFIIKPSLGDDYFDVIVKSVESFTIIDPVKKSVLPFASGRFSMFDIAKVLGVIFVISIVIAMIVRKRLQKNDSRDMEVYSAEEEYQQSTPPPYERGLSDRFDGFTNWVRWVIALPGSAIAYIVIYYVAYLGWHMYVGDAFANGFIGLTIQTVMFATIPLYFIHECVPKFKFTISMITSGIMVFLGISTLINGVYTRPSPMNLDYFFEFILQGAVSTACAVFMIVTFVQHWLEYNKVKS